MQSEVLWWHMIMCFEHAAISEQFIIFLIVTVLNIANDL
jgi:hypothetical protein